VQTLEEIMPKEKIEIVKSIASELGVDRAFVLSEKGFQSGAITAAKKTNLTLSSLEDLRENAQREIDAALIEDLDRRATNVSERISRLHVAKRTRKGTRRTVAFRARPGVESDQQMWMFVRASSVQHAARDARLGKFPTHVGFTTPEEDRPVVARSAADVIQYGQHFLDEAEEWLVEQEDAVTRAGGWDWTPD